MKTDPKVIEAKIQVGETTVPYRRAGSGDPVLLLHEPDPGHVGWGDGAGMGAFDSLAQRYRVFQPMTPLPCRRDHAELWLRGVVEGLGLIRPHVVADPVLAPVLARLVRQNQGIVGQVTFLAGSHSEAGSVSMDQPERRM